MAALNLYLKYKYSKITKYQVRLLTQQIIIHSFVSLVSRFSLLIRNTSCY